MSAEFHDVCRTLGIQHQLSTPHRQGQNGVPERLWRTLCESTVTLLAQSNLPDSFWFLAFQIKVYLHNRLHAEPSPYQRFLGSQPHLPTLQPFGCLAFSLQPKGLSRKLQSRVRLTWFVGYSAESITRLREKLSLDAM